MPTYMILKRLRWSRGSVLIFGTQVSGFKPGRSRRIFQGEKILNTPSFGREIQPFVPCRRFTACKRSLNVTWKSGIFTTRVSGGDNWRWKQERLKTRVCTISLRLQCIRGHQPPGPYHNTQYNIYIYIYIGSHVINYIK